MGRAITIEKNHKAWAHEYIVEKIKIEQNIKGHFKAIEHIGSTAIPGLGAKPIIDMMIGVDDLEEVHKMNEPLAAIGYTHVYHQEFPNRRFFRKGEWRKGTHHLHVYTYNGTEWVARQQFRDYLIAHKEERRAYETLKRSLAERYRNDVVSYTNAKEPFIQEIMAKIAYEESL
ncbi:GrpB family protein [Geomicrobium sp. JCM 19038]|uniref:GrpB family protein n=1 Tax=Geomicrobium sp. JCM 19038 TaxID=1460635 RepID=UPI00045F2D1B|nr:GrpB family protein [Geomicrobium sp. JCM 19038]GAK08802.1 glutamate-rich protein GrpB [Geomicrobium sp. JCM 19038]